MTRARFGIGPVFAMTACVLVISQAFAYWVGAEVLSARRELGHQRTAIAQLDQFLYLVKEAETGQRGYLLTGTESYLDSYREAVANLQSKLAGLDRLLAPDAPPSTEVDQLRDLTTRKLAELAFTIDLRRKGETDAALAAVRTDAGKRLMDQIRTIILAMHDTKERELETALAHTDHLTMLGALVWTLLALFNLGFLLWAYRRIGLEVRLRDAAYQRELTSSESLSQAYADLRENEARLNFALEVGQTGTWDLDITNHLSHHSLRHDHIFGYDSPVPNWGKEAFLAHVLAEDRGFVQEQLNGALASAGDIRFECRIRRVDGAIRWISVAGRPRPNAPHRPSQISGIIQDITEPKEAEVALRQSERIYRAIGESIKYGVWICDSTGRHIYSSESFLKLIGMSQQEFSNFGWVKVLHPDDAERTWEGWTDCQRKGCHWDMEHRFMGVDGEWHPILSRGVPIRGDDGQIMSWAGINLDISSIKKVEEDLRAAKEQAEAASKIKSAFLANMSHEIRTPLGAVLGFSELLASPNITPTERKTFVATIKRNGALLSNIISDVLDLSKIEANKVSIEVDAVTISEVLSDVTALFELQAKEKKLQFTVSSEGTVPAMIRTDALRLRQILNNVVGNALKFTDKGSVCLRLRLDSSNEGKKVLNFMVQDTGIGITEEQAARLFEPFSQADVSTKRRFGGTGLGLILAKRLAELLGGDLVLSQSAPGLGSTFTITIDPGTLEDVPLQILEVETQGLKGTLEKEETATTFAGVKVLVVDDSLDNQFLVSRYLRTAGIAVDVAGNGREALEKAKLKHYDMLFMDLQMPEMDGFECTTELRSLGFRQPIIALTANALNEERQHCLDHGFTGHLSKPVTRQRLLEQLALHRAPGDL